MIHLTIDGKPVEVPENTTVLNAARQAGIEIPTLCDHPALTPYGSCRLCVVEIDGWRTMQASCTLPASEGMVVRTNTPKLRAAREFLLSLLFSERNHFCMYCQKTNGDCELQNAAYAEEMDHWPMQPNWSPFSVDTSHPYYILDNNRCILCRRCVRACSELVGNFTWGLENRGSATILVADTNVPLGESSCIKCGTCVQVCPTGALIDRTSAYLGKDSVAEHVKSVCVGCDVGCGVEAVMLDNLLLHVAGDFSAEINGGVLCELGRYHQLGKNKVRVTKPLVRKGDTLVETTWNEALSILASRLKPEAGQKDGIAALVSSRLSAEALYTFKSLFDGALKADVALSETETGPAANGFGSLNDLKKADCVVVVGTDLIRDHQVAGFFIKRNLPNGTCLIVIDHQENQLAEIADYALIGAPGSEPAIIAGLGSALKALNLGGHDLPEAAPVSGITADQLKGAGGLIGVASRPVIVFGGGSAELQSAAGDLARWIGAPTPIRLFANANSVAAQGYELNKPFALNGHKAVYVALGDAEPTERVIAAIKQAPFAVVQASYQNAATEAADVVLPAETWLEQEGHYLNLEGRLQKTARVLEAPAQITSDVETLGRVAVALGVEIPGTPDAWQADLAAVIINR